MTDFLEASRPAAEAMLVAFQELEKGVDQNEILKNLLASGLKVLQKIYGLNSKALVTGITKALESCLYGYTEEY